MERLKSVEILDFSVMFESHKNKQAEIGGVLKGDLAKSFGEAMTLGEALRGSLAGLDAPARAVDRLLDRAWSGLWKNLMAWEHSLTEDETIPLNKEERESRGYAQSLRVGLLGEGLEFLSIAYLDEWRESGLRLERLEGLFEGNLTYRQALEKLHLGPMVRRIERLHEMYGRALGITAPKETLSAFVAWERAFFRLLHGVFFALGDENEGERNRKLSTLLLEPYEAALERGLERRRRLRESGVAEDPTAPK